MRTALAIAVLLAVPTLAAAQDGKPVWNRTTAKAADKLAVEWWKARPQTKFEEWDAAARAALVEQAKEFGKLPEGKLQDVVKALWKSVAKYGPRHARGKTEIDTPYGKATFIQNGSGKNNGLVVGLHGGGPGAGNASEATRWVAKNCIGMYPQGIRLVHDTWNTVHGERYILTLIEIAKAQYQIDPDRVYVMGFSMGSTGSWHMAGRFPDLLAGALPGNGVVMAGPVSQVMTAAEVQSIQHGLVPNVRNLAVWFFTGLADDHCMPGTFLYINDRIEELRKSDPGGYRKIHFKAYPGLRHTFPPGEPGAGIKFLEAETRETFPKKIVWEYASDPFPEPLDEDKGKCTRIPRQYFYWLKCDKPRDRQVLTATLEDNVITLEGRARGLTIFLNPEMIDPEQDVVVKVRDEEVYRGKPEPDFWTVLETLDARLDTRMVFDRRIELSDR